MPILTLGHHRHVAFLVGQAEAFRPSLSPPAKKDAEDKGRRARTPEDRGPVALVDQPEDYAPEESNESAEEQEWFEGFHAVTSGADFLPPAENRRGTPKKTESGTKQRPDEHLGSGHQESTGNILPATQTVEGVIRPQHQVPKLPPGRFFIQMREHQVIHGKS